LGMDRVERKKQEIEGMREKETNNEGKRKEGRAIRLRGMR